MVFLSWWHSTNHTPSVSPYGLPAPPPGSRGSLAAPSGGGAPCPCCPLWGKCRDSGKGGVVGNFELVPFIGRHPLSQPLRAASSPTGEPRPLLPPPGSRGSLAAPTGEPRFPCCPRWGAERAGGQVQSSVRRKSRILRCLMPLRLISNSSRETTYLGKLSRILSYAPNSRLTVSSEASR